MYEQLEHQINYTRWKKNFNGCNLNILGIIDHKIVHKEKIRIQKYDKCRLITAWRNSNWAVSGRVDLMVIWKSEKILTEVKPINDRIIMTNFNSNQKTTIIINYSPVEGSKDAEEHFENLTNVVNSIPKHNMAI